MGVGTLKYIFYVLALSNLILLIINMTKTFSAVNNAPSLLEILANRVKNAHTKTIESGPQTPDTKLDERLVLPNSNSVSNVQKRSNPTGDNQTEPVVATIVHEDAPNEIDVDIEDKFEDLLTKGRKRVDKQIPYVRWYHISFLVVTLLLTLFGVYGSHINNETFVTIYGFAILVTWLFRLFLFILSNQVKVDKFEVVELHWLSESPELEAISLVLYPLTAVAAFMLSSKLKDSF